MPDFPSEREGLWSDLKDVWEKAKTLSLILTAVTALFSGSLTLLLGELNSLASVAPLIEIVFGTWPVVISAAILFLMIFRNGFEDMGGGERIMAISACVAGPYLIAYYFGASGYDDVRGPVTTSWMQLFHPAHLVWFVINIILHYISLDRLPNTIGAVLSGGFFAWAFEFKLLPHVERLTAKE
jgi:hypothetical protein